MGRSQSQNQRLVTAYGIEITAEAEQEISEAVQWYAAKDRQTAEVFKTIVFESIDIIPTRRSVGLRYPTMESGGLCCHDTRTSCFLR